MKEKILKEKLKNKLDIILIALMFDGIFLASAIVNNKIGWSIFFGLIASLILFETVIIIVKYINDKKQLK